MTDPTQATLTLDADLIMSLEPCDDWPEERVRAVVPKRVAITKFLANREISPANRIWVVLHNVFLSDRTMRIFACDCAERALMREREAGREPDPRSWAAVAVARRYAVGEATDEELRAARDAAGHAARYAAWHTARYAALGAALDAAWYTAWCAAGAAAWDAEREWQCARLVETLEEGI